MIKEQIKAIINQYADKGKLLLEEAYENDVCDSRIGYWDGYKDCGNGLLRELEDIQEIQKPRYPSFEESQGESFPILSNSSNIGKNDDELTEFEKECIKDSDSFQKLAVLLCGYGFFDKAGSDYPIPRTDIKRYLEIGAMFASKQIASEIDNTEDIQKMSAMFPNEYQSMFIEYVEDIIKKIKEG